MAINGPAPSDGESPRDEQSETTSAPSNTQSAPTRTWGPPFAFAVLAMLMLVAAGGLIAAVIYYI